MLKQTFVTKKTGTAVLQDGEIGDIIVDGTSAFTITLPVPERGAWYRISNIGTHTIQINTRPTLVPVVPREQILFLSDNGDRWVYGKGVTQIDKSMVEGVLTGTITSHNHDGAYSPSSHQHSASALTSRYENAVYEGEILYYNNDVLLVEVVI